MIACAIELGCERRTEMESVSAADFILFRSPSFSLFTINLNLGRNIFRPRTYIHRHHAYTHTHTCTRKHNFPTPADSHPHTHAGKNEPFLFAKNWRSRHLPERESESKSQSEIMKIENKSVNSSFIPVLVCPQKRAKKKGTANDGEPSKNDI